MMKSQGQKIQLTCWNSKTHPEFTKGGGELVAYKGKLGSEKTGPVYLTKGAPEMRGDVENLEI